MFTVTFPVEIGTKVKTPDGLIGTIECYQCVTSNNEDDDYVVMVNGCNESWRDEFFLSELSILYTA